MNIRKWLGLPNNKEIVDMVTESVIEQLDKQVIIPILDRLDKRVEEAKKEIRNDVQEVIDNIRVDLLKETDKIKDALTESAEMIQTQATKKVEKQMTKGLNKIKNLFK